MLLMATLLERRRWPAQFIGCLAVSNVGTIFVSSEPVQVETIITVTF